MWCIFGAGKKLLCITLWCEFVMFGFVFGLVVVIGVETVLVVL